MPDSTKNKTSFYTPDKMGNRTEMTRTIYYIKKGTFYEITDAKLFNGQPTSIQTMTISITTNEIQLTKSVSTTVIETNKKQDYNPPRIIFKMPADGQTVEWTYLDISGDTIKCNASWTTVTMDGIQKKAIKVIKTFNGISVKTIEYYVKGIGLWKTKMWDSDGTIEDFDKFDSLSYDSTVK